MGSDSWTTEEYADASAYVYDQIRDKWKQIFGNYAKVGAGGGGEGWSTTGVPCPRYSQGDDRWRANRFLGSSSGTIGGAGCGVCALAMAVSGLTGEEVTPDVIVEELNTAGNGSLSTVINGAGAAKHIAQKYSLTYEHIDRINKTAIDAALDAGKICIFSINANGIYTGGGHFIMCNGRDGDDYYVLESGHFYETDKGYSYNQVFSPGSQGVFVLGN